jgi:hypothetical protein
VDPKFNAKKEVLKEKKIHDFFNHKTEIVDGYLRVKTASTVTGIDTS